MITSYMAKALLKMPSFIVKPASRIIVNKYLDKYAKITVKNGEIIDNIKSPVIFVCNHLSNADGLVLNRVLKKIEPYFIAGVKLNSTPVSRIGLEAVNIIPIQPNSADLDSIKSSISKIKEGKSILIFPEGTRSRSAKLMDGKKGVVLLAKKCKVPIVPLGIVGTEKLMPINDENMGSEKFDYAEVQVIIGEPFLLPEKTREEGNDDYNEKCLKQIMKSIERLLPLEYIK